MFFFPSDRETLQRIEAKIDLIMTYLKKEGERSMAREQELLDAIQAETNAGVAMSLLLDSIADDLSALKSSLDPTAQAKIDEAIARISSNKENWVAKTLENTPAAQ
jgi:hypothetical protein